MNPVKMANPVNVTKGAFGLAGTAVGLAGTVLRTTANVLLSSICMPGPTATTICAGGPPESGNGPPGRDVYAYFNNDGGGIAVRNAWQLQELVGPS